MNKLFILFIIFSVFFSCKKTEIENEPENIVERKGMYYPVSLLESVSKINKTTSWYNTNKSFTSLFSVCNSPYWGFEILDNNLIPYNKSTQNTWSVTKRYYWSQTGIYLYSDFTGDGMKDLFVQYLKYPITNTNGLFLFSEYEKDKNKYEITKGLINVNKCAVSDMNNDNLPDIILFSNGYDSHPFPGDSICIFYPKEKKCKYLSDKIGCFFGCTGDINNDSFVDILMLPLTVYMNNGDGNFKLSNEKFKGFENIDNFSTDELFDLNQDDKLDLVLGSLNKLLIIYQKNGEYNYKDAVSIPIDNGLQVGDVIFFDFNKDGVLDILSLSNVNVYKGFALRMYINVNGSFIDKTSDYFYHSLDVTEVNNSNVSDLWLLSIRFFDYDGDGDLDIVGDGITGSEYENLILDGKTIWWRNNDGLFRKITG